MPQECFLTFFLREMTVGKIFWATIFFTTKQKRPCCFPRFFTEIRSKRRREVFFSLPPPILGSARSSLEPRTVNFSNGRSNLPPSLTPPFPNSQSVRKSFSPGWPGGRFRRPNQDFVRYFGPLGDKIC